MRFRVIVRSLVIAKREQDDVWFATVRPEKFFGATTMLHDNTALPEWTLCYDTPYGTKEQVMAEARRFIKWKGGTVAKYDVRMARGIVHPNF